MRRNKLFITSCLILFLMKGQAQITFQKAIGEINGEMCRSIQQTTDGGYIIGGSTIDTNFHWNVYLIKADINGDTIWTKSFGGTLDDLGNSVQQTTDGGYIVVGERYSFQPNLYPDIYLIKTDGAGNFLWSRTYNSVTYDYGHSVRQTTDGGYIIVGYAGINGGDVYLIKTDSLGSLLWSKTFGGVDPDEGFSVQQTNDGGYIFSAGAWSFGAGSGDVYVVKTDSNGDSLWSKCYGGINYDVGYGIQQTLDGGYIVAGSTYSFGAGFQDVYLLKIDGNGNLLWSKTYGGTDQDIGFFVQQTSDSGYVVVGSTKSFGAGIYENVYLIKTDINGDTLWTRTFGGTEKDIGYCVQQTSDGGYIIGAVTQSFGGGYYDAYLIKTDANGNSGCNEAIPNTIVSSPATIVTDIDTTVAPFGCTVNNPLTSVLSGSTLITPLCFNVGINELINDNSFTIFPNPFIEGFTVNGTIKNGEVIIFDFMGKEIIRRITFDKETKINTDFLSSGFYLLNYREGNKTSNIKLVKL